MTARLALAAVVVIGLAGCTSAKPDPVPSATPVPSASIVESAEPSAEPTPTGEAEPQASPARSQAPRPPRITTPPIALNCTGSQPSDRPQAGGAGPLGTVKTTGNTTVALTFDDGPDPVNTPKVLDLLRQCGVKATFCVNGVKAQANPTLIRRIHNDGHTLCNHTWKHITQLGDYGVDLIRQDLTDTNNAIRAIVPDARVPYFRAPGGRWTADYLSVCQELGMTPTHWDVDTRDWESSRWGKGESMVNHIVGVVQGQTRPGSIVLMHDYQKPDTTTALHTALPWLKARFTLVALPRDGLPKP
ncbi:polysaccharide deacetylase family protein [Allorhizocola rhizosphaerae]|uniref:polysaccharide deacetylase family protein n=1 Tax=Allorhizocola rhizosphaerae TaxID=1872709 RepID=UPI000E3DA6AA|nr:polysaccharide deacetylase family protein [Allorhizocola rhizosphaerae]